MKPLWYLLIKICSGIYPSRRYLLGFWHFEINKILLKKIQLLTGEHMEREFSTRYFSQLFVYYNKTFSKCSLSVHTHKCYVLGFWNLKFQNLTRDCNLKLWPIEKNKDCKDVGEWLGIETDWNLRLEDNSNTYMGTFDSVVFEVIGVIRGTFLKMTSNTNAVSHRVFKRGVFVFCLLIKTDIYNEIHKGVRSVNNLYAPYHWVAHLVYVS